MDRRPAVSGFFYPSSRDDLLKLIGRIYDEVPEPETCDNPIGVVVPHAGFIYSGITAMHSYKALRRSPSRRFVIIGPNHNSYPRKTTVYPEGTWHSPIGPARVDSALAVQISEMSENIIVDLTSHSVEHSIEVQLPFLQYLYNTSFTFCPILMGDQSLKTAIEIAGILSKLSPEVTFIASSDMTHYESHEAARRKDHELISAIESLDVEEFYRILSEKRISSCGYGAIAVLMELTRRKGGKITPIDYRTSGETSGDYSSVVGYASMVACPENGQ